MLRINKYSDAESKLKQLASAMSQDDPQRTFVDVYLAQSQMAQDNLSGVEDKLKAAILANQNKDLRTLAHNVLGDYHRIKKEKDLAFWEYLKVDTLYSEDKEEHAKALYYLSQLFDKPKNDPVRSQGVPGEAQVEGLRGHALPALGGEREEIALNEGLFDAFPAEFALDGGVRESL